MKREFSSTRLFLHGVNPCLNLPYNLATGCIICNPIISVLYLRFFFCSPCNEEFFFALIAACTTTSDMLIKNNGHMINKGAHKNPNKPIRKNKPDNKYHSGIRGI